MKTPPTQIILDEDERVVFFPEEEEEAEPPTKKIDPQLERFNIVGFIQDGAINCAHKVRNSKGEIHVLRVAYLPNTKAYQPLNAKVLRGLQMLHLLQSHRKLLGPSLLQETSTFRVIEETELNKSVMGDLCPKLQSMRGKSKNNRFALQHIEWLQGGQYEYKTLMENSLNDEERSFALFSLIWFVSNAQAAWEWGHHDLKPPNILFRFTRRAKEYYFALENAQVKWYFRFRSRFVPVIIDYDFATVNVTQNKADRVDVGTLYSSSPDSLLLKACTTNGVPYGTHMYYAHAHDWWSLGICFLELFVPNLYNFFGDECDAFADRIMQTPPFPVKNDSRRYFKNFYFACCIASVFAGEERILPPSEYYPYVQQMFQSAESVASTPEYQMLAKWVAEPSNRSVVDLLKQLLHWVPNKRDYSNRGWGHLVRFVKMHAAPPDVPIDSFEFRSTMSPLTPWDVQEFPLLKHPLECATCLQSTSTLALCSCCNQVYCSVECQHSILPF